MRAWWLPLSAWLACTALSHAARAVGVSPGAATAVQREQSQALFVKAKKLFDKKKYAEAVVEFRAAMDIVASPNARLYAARCLRETGRLVEAYVEFDRTAVEANELAREDSRYKRTGASAMTERDALAPKIGFLTVRIDHATDATQLRVAGEEIRQAGWSEPVPVMPGATEVRVSDPTHPEVRQTVVVAAGEKKVVAIDTSPSVPPVVVTTAPDRRALRPYAYVSGGVGAVGLVTFAIAGILSDTTYSDLGSKCGSRPCPASDASEVSRGQAEQTAADVALAIGLVGLAAGATLFVLSLPPKTERGPETPAPAPAAALSVGPGWLGVEGRF